MIGFPAFRIDNIVIQLIHTGCVNIIIPIYIEMSHQVITVIHIILNTEHSVFGSERSTLFNGKCMLCHCQDRCFGINRLFLKNWKKG